MARLPLFSAARATAGPPVTQIRSFSLAPLRSTASPAAERPLSISGRIFAASLALLKRRAGLEAATQTGGALAWLLGNLLGGLVLLWVDRRAIHPTYTDASKFPLSVYFRIGLFQCLAASRPSYEDIFCIGRHVARDLLVFQAMLRGSAAVSRPRWSPRRRASPCSSPVRTPPPSSPSSVWSWWTSGTS